MENLQISNNVRQCCAKSRTGNSQSRLKTKINIIGENYKKRNTHFDQIEKCLSSSFSNGVKLLSRHQLHRTQQHKTRNWNWDHQMRCKPFRVFEDTEERWSQVKGRVQEGVKTALSIALDLKGPEGRMTIRFSEFAKINGNSGSEKKLGTEKMGFFKVSMLRIAEKVACFL